MYAYRTQQEAATTKSTTALHYNDTRPHSAVATSAAAGTRCNLQQGVCNVVENCFKCRAAGHFAGFVSQREENIKRYSGKVFLNEIYESFAMICAIDDRYNNNHSIATPNHIYNNFAKRSTDCTHGNADID